MAVLAMAAGAVYAGARTGGGAALAPAVTVRAAGASNPTAAADPRGGDALVAWVGGADVWLARVSAAGAVSPPLRVNDVAGDAAPHEQAPAQVRTGADGAVYVAWQKATRIPGRRFPASDLRLARSADGGRTFAPAVTVNDDAGGLPASHTFHDVAVAADGRVVVSWIDGRAKAAHDARSAAASPAPARSGNAASPSHATSEVTGASAAHGGHATAEHAKGTHGSAGHGIGGGGDGPSSELRVAVSADGGRTFSASRVVDADVCPCCRTALAAGADGTSFVAWRKVFDGDVRDVVVARVGADGSPLGAPVRVHADGWVFPGCPHAGPAVAVDGRGRVHVAWYTGREGRQGLWHAVSADGGRTFGAPRPLVTGAWVPPSQVRLVAEGDGVWISWDDRRAKEARVVVARADGDEARPRVVGEAGAGRSPALAFAAGTAWVAWLDGEAVRTRRFGGR
jgi:hypothetical protein